MKWNCTDFGMKNFYLTDTFKTACIWAQRNNQAAVVIFIIPNTYIESLENHLILNEEEIWKETVYKIRNKPKPDLLDYTKEKRNYKKFIKDIDSNDLISGPICANPTAHDIDDIRPIKCDGYIPYQYSFKESTIDDLNSMKAITLFFEET